MFVMNTIIGHLTDQHFFGILSTAKDAPLSIRKVISSHEGKTEAVSIWEWVYILEKQAFWSYSLCHFSGINIIFAKLSIDFERFPL